MYIYIRIALRGVIHWSIHTVALCPQLVVNRMSHRLERKMHTLLARCKSLMPNTRMANAAGVRRYLQSHHGGHLHLQREIITQEEHDQVVAYLEPLLARKRYEGDHWDSVITAYKEMELPYKRMPEPIRNIFASVEMKIRAALNKPDEPFLPLHVIALDTEGHIDGHIDSVKFSGDMIAALSLLSERTLVLERAKDEDIDTAIVASYAERTEKEDPLPHRIELLIPPRSMYILTGRLRYEYMHAVLGGPGSERRISVMCRNEKR